jgi:Putative Actinobacterial Holin-X, holin superfamily III
LPGSDGQPDNITQALADVSERVTALVHDEIELAKAEVGQKVMSILRGTVAVAAGAVFGIFAVIFFLITVGEALNSIFVSGAGNLWIGFLIVSAVLVVLTLGSFLFAWRKLRVGAPTPTMAIDEAKKIRATVTAGGSSEVVVPAPERAR